MKLEHRSLERCDTAMDLPKHFLPDFPPPIYLTSRPDLGDVSQGKLLSIKNYFDFMVGILTPVQMEGLRLLLTPFPQQQFNQQIHGSKRSLRSVEDFTEFEQRTAYFDGDHVTAAKKGINLPDRNSQVAMMAQMQNMFDFPPAPKLDVFGKLNPRSATDQELMGQEVFFGKARCDACHPAPFYTDDKMHDLKVGRYYKPEMINGQYNISDGPIKSFTLRGIKDSPPYMHDGRCLTLADTVEFFNLVTSLNLTKEEKEALVAFMMCL